MHRFVPEVEVRQRIEVIVFDQVVERHGDLALETDVLRSALGWILEDLLDDVEHRLRSPVRSRVRSEPADHQLHDST